MAEARLQKQTKTKAKTKVKSNTQTDTKTGQRQLCTGPPSMYTCVFINKGRFDIKDKDKDLKPNTKNDTKTITALLFP